MDYMAKFINHIIHQIVGCILLIYYSSQVVRHTFTTDKSLSEYLLIYSFRVILQDLRDGKKDCSHVVIKNPNYKTMAIQILLSLIIGFILCYIVYKNAKKHDNNEIIIKNSPDKIKEKRNSKVTPKKHIRKGLSKSESPNKDICCIEESMIDNITEKE